MMSQLKAVILAAGKGTRMKSDLPKVVHTIEGKCLVDYAIEAAEGAGAGEILPCGRLQIRDRAGEHFAQGRKVCITGAAAGNRSCGAVCKGISRGGRTDTDSVWRYPSYHGRDLKEIKEHHIASGNTVTVLSAMVEDPTGYGRIIRDADGNFVKSVEHKDATEAELASREINSVCIFLIRRSCVRRWI